jgi:hypothetical protein
MPDQPSVTISGVPETIKRADYLAMIERLGLDYHHLVSLEFGRKAIYAEVFALNAEGKRYEDPLARNALAKHRIVIPVED